MSTKSSPSPIARPSFTEKLSENPRVSVDSVLAGSYILLATSILAVEAPSSRPPARSIRSSTVVFSAYGNTPGLLTYPFMVSIPLSTTSCIPDTISTSFLCRTMSSAAPESRAPRSTGMFR